MSINSNNNLLNEILSTIDELPTSKEEQEKVVDITENGITEVTPDEGKALSKVTVNVEVDQSCGEEFVGIKLSDFQTGGYHLPQIADARSITVSPNAVQVHNTNYFNAWFYNVNGNGNGGFYVNLKEVYLPDNMHVFSGSMFRYCVNLTTLHGDFSKVTHIETDAFSNCKKLPQIPYCPNLRVIRGGAFSSCIALTEVVLPATITNIDTNAFNGCTNLLDIYVPWAEGAVANAPWGATNATIHYNTTFDENGNPIISEV